MPNRHSQCCAEESGEREGGTKFSERNILNDVKFPMNNNTTLPKNTGLESTATSPPPPNMDTSLWPITKATKKEQTYLSILFNFKYRATQLEHGRLPSHFVFFVRQCSHEAHNCDDDTSIIADARFVIAKSLYDVPIDYSLK